MSTTVAPITDVDEACTQVGNIFCPHRLTPLGRDALRLTLHSRRVGGVGIVHLDYGVPVRIDPGMLETFYLVQLPLAGSARIDQGSESLESSAATASVLSPDRPVTMEWGGGNPQSIVYVERATVEAQLARMLGRPVTTPVHFQLAMPTSSHGARSFRRAVDYARDEVNAENPLLALDHLARQLEDVLVSRLLTAQPHNYSEQLAGGPAATSRTIRRAFALIRDHHAENLTVADVAEAVGVSVRALQEGFRRELYTTPTAALRNTRMHAVHSALASADPTRQTVTAIALAHGFSHLGRFSVEYRQQFGESPSVTLHG